ncbi:sugar dehydrogenase complex small subunit [Neorhizobium sp. NCHU2750]|uniref:sugar dehydrogenase complex small subunit n=1 Tax=Neorhizobium sp. NCHU2750 TaxID=1825976 RepID=UPI0013C4D475
MLKTLSFSVPAAWLLTGSMSASGALAQVVPTAKAPADFMQVSRLLTGHPEIEDTLADMAWSALTRREEHFEAGYKALVDAIKSSGLSDFAALEQSPVMTDAALKATAVSLVSAWYLGRVGEVLDRGEPGPDFITYTGALMWRPTIDVTVLPTYARGGPGYWATPPATLATD